jgi:hypothetical protein
MTFDRPSDITGRSSTVDACSTPESIRCLLVDASTTTKREPASERYVGDHSLREQTGYSTVGDDITQTGPPRAVPIARTGETRHSRTLDGLRVRKRTSNAGRLPPWGPGDSSGELTNYVGW